MANRWEAEIEFSLEQARALVDVQFPELAPAQLEPYGKGWDNLALLVNRQWVFRFPQRELARQTMEGELACLQRLPLQLPLKVPRPKFIGKPQGKYPYPFSGYRELAGRTGCSVSLTADQRVALALPLASFLAELHKPALAEAGRGAFHDDRIQRSNLPRQLVRLEERLTDIQEYPEGVSRNSLTGLARQLAQSPAWQGPTRLVHGDLYGRHLLFGEEGRLTGVIDWGDAHLGDPALDLSVAYAFLPDSARQEFWACYGEVDSATKDRARFRALASAAALVQYGDKVGDEPIARLGRLALWFASQH